MKKIYVFKAGNTLGAHEKIVKKLTKRGAKVVEAPDDSLETVVFCPIVSRYETDINSALSSASEKGCKNIILVTMHHTFDEDYTLPNHREMENGDVILHVDCLFFETKGLLKCSCNKKAVKAVCKQLGLKKKLPFGKK
ncbi:hypothetical protein ABVT39_020451 [Epinephelus coioides]